MKRVAVIIKLRLSRGSCCAELLGCRPQRAYTAVHEAWRRVVLGIGCKLRSYGLCLLTHTLLADVALQLRQRLRW